MANELENWNKLLKFKPKRRLQGDLTIRTGGRVQFIEDGIGDVSFDLYPVKVTRLPVKGVAKPVSTERLLSTIRNNINEFIDTRNTMFSPFGLNKTERSINERRWHSNSPLGAILHLDINILPGSLKLNVEDATVMVTEFTAEHWVFSTVYTPANQYHPVCGNREFGFVMSSDSSFIFYTKGVDRVSGVFDFFANSVDLIQDGQVDLWTSFQKKIARFVNTNGGSAKIISHTIKRQKFK